MSEPNVHEQLAGMTIERDAAQAERDAALFEHGGCRMLRERDNEFLMNQRDAALASVARVHDLASKWMRKDGMVAWDIAAGRIYDAIDGRL